MTTRKSGSSTGFFSNLLSATPVPSHRSKKKGGSHMFRSSRSSASMDSLGSLQDELEPDFRASATAAPASGASTAADGVDEAYHSWAPSRSSAPARVGVHESRYVAQMQALKVLAPQETSSRACSTAAARGPEAELTDKIKLIVRQELSQILNNGVVLSLQSAPGGSNISSTSALADQEAINAGAGRAAREHNYSCAQYDQVKQVEALRTDHERIKVQLEESRERERNLQEEVETLRPQQFGFKSGAFEDGGPSPPLFQDALAAVQVAIATCASKLGTHLKEYLQGGKSHRLKFQIQLCQCLFHDFETSSYGGTQMDLLVPIFLRPNKDLKHRLFKEYLDYRGTSAPSLLDTPKTFFQPFFDSRVSILVYNGGKYEPFTSEFSRKTQLARLLSNKNEKNSLIPDFARLAKAVWLLHKLAFSFEPSVEIFRVHNNCLYDSEYMDLFRGEDGMDKEELQCEQVLMIMPGFTVRNFVFKSQVQLLPSGSI